MADKPKRASEYKSEQVELVRATCLYVATKLGDMMDDLLIIGGLVPSLIVDQVDLPEGTDAHVGTMDLDVGLQLAPRFGSFAEGALWRLFGVAIGAGRAFELLIRSGSPCGR